MENNPPSTAARFLAETLGTFILIFFGCGAVHIAVTTGATSGVLQVALVWGIGVMVGAYVSGGVSGGHLNPAVTVALAAWKGFPRQLVLPYCVAQLLGAALAALVLHIIFSGTIEAFEASKGITRGAEASVLTASMYGEYFPTPGVAIHGGPPGNPANLSVPAAALAEVVATAILVMCVFAVTSGRGGAPGANLAPLFIGLCVAALIVVIGPLTQCCLNPARDFGPRIVAYFVGWKSIAFPGPRGAGGSLVVYLAAPVAGALLGGWIHTRWIARERA